MENRRPDYSDCDTSEKLQAALMKLLGERCLPVNKMGGINRKAITDMAGFPLGSLSERYAAQTYKWAKKVVDEFEAMIKESEGGYIAGINLDYGTPVRLRKLLEELRETLDLPMSRHGINGGHISFIEFQRKYGFPDGSLTGKGAEWKWARDMLAGFDSDLYENGMIGTTWEMKVPGIRKYLEGLMKRQSLPINELGKLNRREVMVKFGMPRNQSTNIAESRSPKLKELFVEYDEHLKEGGYSQYQGDACQEKMRKILDGEDIVLDKSLRVISIKWLAEELGIKRSVIANTPKLIEIIEKKTREIHESQRRGKTKKSFNIFGAASINLGATPYSKKHKRVFPFDSLIPLYGLEFAEKIGTGFIAITNDFKGMPKAYFSRIKDFLEWIADDNNGAIAIADALRENKKVNQVKFERACMEYHAYLLTEGKVKPERYSLAVITKFGDARLLPQYHFRRKARKGASKDKTHRQSILEAARKSYKDKALSILDDAAKYRNIELDHGRDTKAFVETLVYEKESREDLSDDISEAMLQISCDRLLETQKQASTVFRDWQKTHQEGVELIAQASPCGEEIARMMDEYGSNKQSNKWRRFLSTTFPKNDKRQALCNLLALIKTRFKGIPPSASITNDQFWSKLYSRFGGIEKIASYQLPTRKAVSAGLALYLCESGANVSVALVLAPDCVRNSDVPAHKKVVSKKDRAKGKTIYDDLSVKSKDKDCTSAVTALEYMTNAIAHIKQELNDDQWYLALHYSKGQVVNLLEYNFREDFKSICNSSGYLSQFYIVPSMIRPTVLLETQLKNPTNLGYAQLIAQHESETTTSGYTNKLPHRAKMEEHILGYQRSLEFVVSQKVAQPHVKIGVPESEWERRLEHAQRTGLGVFCENRVIVDEHGNKTKCVDVENCIKCKHDRMLVSADTISIAEMMIWKKSLDEHEEEWISERLDRWNEIWVPWQTFFHVVLEEKMSRGKLSKIKSDATTLATTQMSQDGFVMPEPW